MKVGGSIKVDGEKEIKNLLKELPKRVETKALRAAVTAMLTPMARAAKAKARANQESGLLSKAIGKKTKSGKRGVYGLIGARASITGTYKGRTRVPANYLHLVELGTKAHAIGEHQHPGTKASPFLQPAYDETRDAAEAVGKRKMAEVIDKEAKKLGKM